MANAERIRSAGKDDYHIHLNFLPVDTSDGHFVIYRRKCASHLEQRPRSDASAHGLPEKDASEANWPSYWVLLDRQTPTIV
jgi:hypothetical protein